MFYLISAIAIQGYGTLNRDLLATTLVSRRPESLGDWAGDFIFDGQHKGIMHFVSGIETDNESTWLPCQVKVWPEGMSLEEIRHGEAELFIKHNSDRKNPTKVDIYRSGVLLGDPEALKIETILKNLNLVIDGFGSTEDGVITLKVPNPTRRTSAPPFNELVILLNTESTTFDASVFDKLDSLATLLISSSLFINKSFKYQKIVFSQNN